MVNSVVFSAPIIPDFALSMFCTVFVSHVCKSNTVKYRYSRHVCTSISLDIILSQLDSIFERRAKLIHGCRPAFMNMTLRMAVHHSLFDWFHYLYRENGWMYVELCINSFSVCIIVYKFNMSTEKTCENFHVPWKRRAWTAQMVHIPSQQVGLSQSC